MVNRNVPAAAHRIGNFRVVFTGKSIRARDAMIKSMRRTDSYPAAMKAFMSAKGGASSVQTTVDLRS